ncbi:MAG: polymer-forming cytoskeletal protein [Firmicutes bacterium]|nr:polymer-forming cytoskeletal protein [Bacillota bacterium]
MFGKKAVIPQVEVPGTVIGKGITLEAAVLTGKESVRIDGVFLGDVNLDGSLILGETGSIEGTVKAKYIILAGLVRGNIDCDGTLHVSSTARINGDIKTNSIIVDEGGQLNGRYQVGELPMVSADKQPLLSTSSSKGDDKSYLDKSLEIIDKRDQDN